MEIPRVTEEHPRPSQAALDRAETLWWMAGEPHTDRAETITEMAKLLDAFAASRLAARAETA